MPEPPVNGCVLAWAAEAASDAANFLYYLRVKEGLSAASCLRWLEDDLKAIRRAATDGCECCE